MSWYSIENPHHVAFSQSIDFAFLISYDFRKYFPFRCAGTWIGKAFVRPQVDFCWSTKNERNIANVGARIEEILDCGVGTSTGI